MSNSVSPFHILISWVGTAVSYTGFCSLVTYTVPTLVFCFAFNCKNVAKSGVFSSSRLKWITEFTCQIIGIFFSTLFLQVTSEKLCRAQHDLHFQAATYLCLLRSVREHLVLHQEYHGGGEYSAEQVAGRVGLKLPQQPGGKGWEP